ncbi:hypothetical protein D7W82_32640 [Corallococcus sp. CA049B]|nr:hypothetical protein D7W82_32640 [Corallococcus sp. CA049B]
MLPLIPTNLVMEAAAWDRPFTSAHILSQKFEIAADGSKRSRSIGENKTSLLVSGTISKRVAQWLFSFPGMMMGFLKSSIEWTMLLSGRA